MQQNITEETKLDIKRLNHVMEVCLNTYVRRSHRLFEINRQLFFIESKDPSITKTNIRSILQKVNIYS